MAATTLDRNTKKRGPIRQKVLAMATGSTIPIGVMVSVATPSAGAVNAADTATHVVMGVSCQAASQAAGDTKIVVEAGIFNMANDGSITAVLVGQPCFVVDNQTVGTAAGPTNDIIAGYVVEVDADGVWVDMTQAKIAAA
jgi:predicted RecA/RadA family phage recombinase